MEENMNNKWYNFFCNIENKYNLNMNKNKPIVIFLDGKNITKNIKYDLISENKNSFNDIFEQTIKYFTNKLDCIAISGVDEVSFILENSSKLQPFISKNKYRAHEIVSIFSQNFYNYFNNKYIGENVYWHCKCSNIPKEKIKSYIRYRSLTIFELKLTYFLKRKQFKNAGKIVLSEKKKKCYELKEYKELKKFERGKLYYRGQQIDLESFLYDKIIELPSLERDEKITFLDIHNF